MMNHFNHLGYYYGEEKLDRFLKALNIYETPSLPRDDTDTYLLNEKIGVELTFSDSESIKFPTRDYPDGALVLVNIRYYGKK